MMYASKPMLKILVLLLMLFVPSQGRAYQAALIRTIQVVVPPGMDLFEAYDRVRNDEGRMLDEAMVKRHLETLGQLGWVEAVNVDIRPAASDLYFDLIYRLIPRHRVREVRIEGARALDPQHLETVVSSQKGTVFDLRRALDDAHEINMAYQNAGYSLSGVLDSRNVRFQDGVLTFQVAEAHLDETEARRLAGKAEGTQAHKPLDRRAISSMMADLDLNGYFQLRNAQVQVDRRSGALHFQGGRRN
jgi:hypothetical protein